MARRTRTITRTVQVPASRAGAIRIAMPAPIRARARRVGSGIMSEKHTLTPLLAAYLLGVAKKNGTSLPTIMGLGPAASVGLIAWAVGKYGKNQMARHAATGLLSVAVYSYGKGEGIAGVAGAESFEDDDDQD